MTYGLKVYNTAGLPILDTLDGMSKLYYYGVHFAANNALTTINIPGFKYNDGDMLIAAEILYYRASSSDPWDTIPSFTYINVQGVGYIPELGVDYSSYIYTANDYINIRVYEPYPTLYKRDYGIYILRT